ncbi:MAG TPA: AAA family ATPase [Casimicrobiaceae bacterium]|nr:AAA family ATPase [Casimicrobiaceae bacterium]
MTERSGHAARTASPIPIRLRFDRYELDEANARLLRDGTPVPVAPTPFGVLCALARQPGSLLTTNALLDEVWGHQFVTDSVLRTAISELRTALDDDARKPRFIETVSRRGYRFIAATSPMVAAPPVAPVASPSRSAEPRSFIGRAEALLRLRTNWDLACTGERRIVWVAGEPGIGKTTLIEHFIAALGDVLCVRGQCVDQYGSGEPYLPVLEALSELCRIDTTMVPLLRAVAPTWLLQLPWLGTPEERDALRRELAGVAPDRMLREIGEVLDRSSERRPLLLVTEDLHWSDRATLNLIDYAARRRSHTRLLWLASFRIAEVVALDHPLNRLRRELRLHGLCEEIVLDPFSEKEVAEYVAKRSPGVASDEAFVRALHERTDGMPLFVASIMNEMSARAAEGGRVVAPEQVAKIAVPENLAAIIEHYIAKLENEQRTALSAAAVCGVQFRVKTIAAALDRDTACVGDVCDDLAREQVWLLAPRPEDVGEETETSYSFRHALFRQVLYERMAPSLRAQLHRKIGAALERERATREVITAAELATHFERGGDVTQAVRYYAEAAEDALARWSPEACLRIVERASSLLQHAPRGPEHSQLQITIESLHGLAAIRVRGAGNEAKSALQRAYSLLDEAPQHPMRGRLLHGFGFMLTLRAEYAEALAVADRAEALGSAENDPVLLSSACTVHGQVDQLQGRPGAARTWLARGLALVEHQDEAAPGEFLVDPQVALRGLLANPLLYLGRLEHARACLERASLRARALKWPMARLVSIWYSALFEVRLGNVERVAALADEMRALVDEFALAHGRTACRWFRGWANARMGAAHDGFKAIREAHDENTRLGMLAGASEVLGYATEALILAGDLDGAQKQLEEALRIAEEFGERVYLTQLHLMQAAIARARGERKAAGASVRRAIAEARAQEAPWLELIAMIDLCENDRVKPDDLSALATLVDQLPEASGTTAVVKAWALIDMAKRG